MHGKKLWEGKEKGMTKIVLVRHGQTEWNISGRYQGQTDVPLSAEGVEQARRLAEDFPVGHLDAIYSSDLDRARVTAECLAKHFELPVRLEASFRELNFGAWEGLSYEEIISRWPDALENFLRHPDRLHIPEGESFLALQERAMAKVHEIVAAHPGKTVAVVAHGGILRTILCNALHMPLEYLWSIRQFNTAVSIVCYEDGWSSVELMNSTAHLGKSRILEKI